MRYSEYLTEEMKFDIKMLCEHQNAAYGQNFDADSYMEGFAYAAYIMIMDDLYKKTHKEVKACK